MELVAFLGNDKESWGQISALIKRAKWDKILIVKNKEADDFPIENSETIKINTNQPIALLKNEMVEKLREKLSGEFEIALSIASGNGKEHMAIISALLCIPVGIKLVAYTKDGVEFIN
ncbi:MAG: hypothetical protein AABX85_02045 [Nanoarchaeota archaeon]